MAYGNGGYGQAMPTGGPTVQAAPRPASVHAEVGSLDAAVSDLHMQLDELLMRLQGVMMPAPPGTNGLDKTPELPVPLANAINASVLRVRQACARIQDINARLEV